MEKEERKYVKCINTIRCINNITNGKEYEVISEDSTYYCILDNTNTQNYFFKQDLTNHIQKQTWTI